MSHSSFASAYPKVHTFAQSLEVVQQQRSDLEYVYQTRETHTPGILSTEDQQKATDVVEYPEQRVWLKPIPVPNLFGAYAEQNPLECIGLVRIVRFEDVHRVQRRLYDTPTGVRAWVRYSAEFHKFVFVRFTEE